VLEIQAIPDEGPYKIVLPFSILYCPRVQAAVAWGDPAAVQVCWHDLQRPELQMISFPPGYNPGEILRYLQDPEELRAFVRSSSGLILEQEM
jgi:hypothetical protein